MIPGIGIPVINRGDWLKRLVYSIDAPLHRIAIVRQRWIGGPEAADVDGAIKELLEVFGADNIVVHRAHGNIGCAAAWNLLAKLLAPAVWWLTLGSDVALRPGTLSALQQFVEERPGTIVLAPGFRNFVFWRSSFRRVGEFDENIYPAYMEDVDYLHRIKLLNQPVESFNLDHMHGDNLTGFGSLTQQQAKNHILHYKFAMRNALSHENNFKYVHLKFRGYTAPMAQNTATSLEREVHAAKLTFTRPFGGMFPTIQRWSDWILFSGFREAQESIWNFSLSPKQTLRVDARLTLLADCNAKSCMRMNPANEDDGSFDANKKGEVSSLQGHFVVLDSTM